jgi:hypothetical protein
MRVLMLQTIEQRVGERDPTVREEHARRRLGRAGPRPGLEKRLPKIDDRWVTIPCRRITRSCPRRVAGSIDGREVRPGRNNRCQSRTNSSRTSEGAVRRSHQAGRRLLATTLSNAAAIGATTITVPSNVNAADQDAIRIGSGETAELNQINGAITGVGPYVITLKTPLQKAHAAGEDVKEMTVYDLRRPGEGRRRSGRIRADQRRHGRDAAPADHERQGLHRPREFHVPVPDDAHVRAVGRHSLTLISGAGTVPSPKQLITDGNEFGTDNDLCIIAIGVLVDGTFVAVELWGCNMDYTQGQVQLQRGHRPASTARRSHRPAA